ncbi:putative ATP-dependent RNA helicase DDX4 isoform X1 [Tachypleus tridentatus]|uniref:putative ATP-dependent RNA helicase DDX4 isoform X1 n=1 Tax=Tachypleus tridentatus TaxID=6853 RepID=UPI003FD57F7E
MLEMCFVPAVIKMVDDPSMTVKSKHQTLMFSTTFPEEIQRLAAEFLKLDYLFLAVGVVGSADMDVKQNFYQVQQYEKRQKLIEILNNSENYVGLYAENRTSYISLDISLFHV